MKYFKVRLAPKVTEKGGVKRIGFLHRVMISLQLFFRNMKITLITPTAERPRHLILLYEIVCNQKFEWEWEWLIHDSSFRPNPFFENLKDKRVHYIYTEEKLSIGTKRNRLCERAQGDYIAHFDDDDFYAPNYLQHLFAHFEDNDFFTFSSWFCYHQASDQFFYFGADHQMESCFILNPVSSLPLHAFTPSETEEEKQSRIEHAMKGYGFTYAYKRELLKKCTFPDLSFGEDRTFYQEAEKLGAKMKLSEDREGVVLHIIHAMNTSSSFPEYRLPRFIAERYFPTISNYLVRYPSDDNY